MVDEDLYDKPLDVEQFRRDVCDYKRELAMLYERVKPVLSSFTISEEMLSFCKDTSKLLSVAAELGNRVYGAPNVNNTLEDELIRLTLSKDAEELKKLKTLVGLLDVISTIERYKSENK